MRKEALKMGSGPKMVLGILFTLNSIQALAQTPLGEGVQAKLTYEIPDLADPTHALHRDEAITELTLELSIQTAIAGATAVQKAKNQFELSGEQLIQSYAQFLPNLVGQAGFNNVEGKSYFTTAQPTFVETRNHGASYAVSTTLNLFNGFADISGLKASMARKKSSDLSLERAKQEIALDVAQTYLQVILDRHIVDIAEKNLASSQAREQLFTEQARVGIRNLADLYRQQAQTSSDESYLVSSQDKERTDELLLLRKLRMEPSGRYTFVDPRLSGDNDNPDPRFSDEGKMLEMALAARPDLAAQTQTSKAFDWDVHSAQSSYYPHLDFGLGLVGGARALDYQTVNGVDVTTGFPTQSFADQLGTETAFTAGLSLTWTLFDRWMTKTNVERAHVSFLNSDLDLTDLHNRVVAEVRQAYGDYRTVLQQLQSSAKGLNAAQKAYEVVEGRYKVGSASFIDLIAAQAALVSADAARSQALISFALQNRVLETVLGTANF